LSGFGQFGLAFLGHGQGEFSSHGEVINQAGQANADRTPTLFCWLTASVVFLAVGLAEAFGQQRKSSGAW
jgi:hypothetical protein